LTTIAIRSRFHSLRKNQWKKYQNVWRTAGLITSLMWKIGMAMAIHALKMASEIIHNYFSK